MRFFSLRYNVLARNATNQRDGNGSGMSMGGKAAFTNIWKSNMGGRPKRIVE